MLSALTNPVQIGTAWARAVQTVTEAAVEQYDDHLSWPGPHGGYDATFFKLPAHEAWAAPLDIENRLRMHLGVGADVVPAVEVNVNKQGETWKTQGAFGIDGAGKVYLFHSGRLGGGSSGVSGQNFLDRVTWDKLQTLGSKGKTRRGAALGPIDDPALVEDLAAYARAAYEFRR